MQLKNELPEGWELPCLKDILDINPPKPRQDAVPSDTAVSFVPMPAVDADLGSINASEVRTFAEVRKGYTAFQNEDVIFAKITPCMENGKAAIARNLLNNLGFGSTEFIVFRSNGAIVPDYLYHYIRQESYRKLAEANMTGSVGQKRVPKEFVQNSLIPLPPLQEQQRIVESIERLFIRLDKTTERLGLVPTTMKMFRQSVLEAAFAGELTENFVFKTDQPNEWKDTELNQIGNWSTGGTPSRKIKEYFGGNISWVKSGDLNDGIVLDTEEKITQKGLDNCSAKLLSAGSLSIALYGATIGKLGILGIDAATNQACANCVPNKKLIDTRYLFYYLLQQRKKLIEAGQGGAQPNITNKIIRQWPIKLPTLPEQQEIVRRVDSLFAFADSIESKVIVAREKTDQLRQSILAKAFSGELVPTEAELAKQEGRDYESAGVLLERIKAERASSKKKKK